MLQNDRIGRGFHPSAVGYDYDWETHTWGVGRIIYLKLTAFSLLGSTLKIAYSIFTSGQICPFYRALRLYRSLKVIRNRTTA